MAFRNLMSSLICPMTVQLGSLHHSKNLGIPGQSYDFQLESTATLEIQPVNQRYPGHMGGLSNQSYDYLGRIFRISENLQCLELNGVPHLVLSPLGTGSTLVFRTMTPWSSQTLEMSGTEALV